MVKMIDAIDKHSRQSRLPIPDVLPEKQAPIVALVEQILAAKKHNTVGANCVRPPLGGDTNGGGIANSSGNADKGACHAPLHEPQPDIPALEAEIDRLVYALYGLTDEEIAVVEKA